MAKAAFGAGCFWGVEESFRQLAGVISATSGYMGGHRENPTYKEVCTDTTGHAEVVLVEYDPAILSFDTLLDHFWHMHDPTQKNRQGPDIGSQYRSVIFTYTPEQKTAAEKSRATLDTSGLLRAPVATEIHDAPAFWPAEEYHQRYLEKRGLNSCHF